MQNILSDYKLNDSNGEPLVTKDKRIYAPNIVAVIDGKATELTTGISEKQTDANLDLTDAILDDTYQAFKCIVKCVVETEAASCPVEKSC